MPPIAIANLAAIGIVLVTAGIMMSVRGRSRNMEGLFFTSILLFLLLFVDDLALGLVTNAASVRYDEYVYCFDRTLGSPSFLLGRLFASHAWFRNVSLYAYVLIPSACLGVVTAYFFLQPFKDAIRCVRTIVTSGLLAYPFYLVFPVAGPRYAFPTFPWTEPGSLIPRVIHLRAYPNGVPSVHMSLALLVFWFSRRWKVGRAFGIVFVVLIAASTMGSGEHYLFDLIAAVPYTALVVYLCDFSPGELDKNVSVPASARPIDT